VKVTFYIMWVTITDILTEIYDVITVYIKRKRLK